MRYTSKHKVIAGIAAAVLLSGGAGLASTRLTAATAVVTSTAAPPVKVVGNHIVNAQTGAVIQLHGVNESSWVNDCANSPNYWNGTVAEAAQPATWTGINAIRIHINEDCWLGLNNLPRDYSAASYRNAIKTAVSDANAAGLEVDLTLGWSAPGTTQSLGQNTMIDASHGPALWDSVASVFGRNLAVIFELYNEPRPDHGQDDAAAAECVKNGGPAGTCAPFATAGMQAITDDVRKAGAENIILEGGPHSEEDPHLWNTYEVTDPLHDVAAAWHVYPRGSCHTLSCWTGDVKPVADQVPVIASEVGDQVSAGACSDSYPLQAADWMDGTDHGAISPVAFVWDTHFGGCDNMLANFNGTPTSYGSVWKSAFAVSLGSSPPPPTNAPATAASAPAGHNGRCAGYRMRGRHRHRHRARWVSRTADRPGPACGRWNGPPTGLS
ncbi:MAG: cellulase family glycosylhydrolase [Streptosporangiaceae bacterium]|nr:cellulase family glycosylhydrolase [Streptosporangiaceae bacterium]